MSVRVVLYAEGSAEHAGEVRMLPAPGEELDDMHLGPAHILIRRMVASAAGCPEQAVRFVSPLRLRARTARGGDLLVPGNLRRLVAFPLTHRRPDLAVVLIDEDGEKARHGLRSAFENSVVPSVLGIAAPEFEAWLIADHAALCSALGIAVDAPSTPDGMSRHEAKDFLNAAARQAGRDGEVTALRSEIASKCDLNALQHLKAIETLIKEITRIVRRT